MRIRASLFLAAPIALLVSCAPTVKDPFGTALHQGRVPSSLAPESLTVDLGVVPRQKGLPSFSARLYAQPNRRYRIDVLGLASTVASYFWVDDRWTLLLNERSEVWTGEGDTLDVEGVSLRLPGVNMLLGFLWGDPLPGFRNRDADTLTWGGDTLHWSVRGTRWQARFDPVSGACLEARSAKLALKYSRHRLYGDHVLPAEVEVFVEGKPLLLLRVDRIEEHPVWKKNPFALVVPARYEHRTSGFPPDDGAK